MRRLAGDDDGRPFWDRALFAISISGWQLLHWPAKRWKRVATILGRQFVQNTRNGPFRIHHLAIRLL